MVDGKSTVATPFLKWSGGKRQLLPKLQEYVPVKFGSYFEPFVGGGALLFYLLALDRPFCRIRRESHVGDTNIELVATYRAVRDQVEEVISLLRVHAREHGEDSEGHYYEVRGCTESNLAAMAARMIYLNRTCFNGLIPREQEREVQRSDRPVHEPDDLRRGQPASVCARAPVRDVGGVC